jgi:biopolymer transport protein ExbB
MWHANASRNGALFALALCVCLVTAGGALAQDKAAPAGGKKGAPAANAQPLPQEGKEADGEKAKKPESLFDLIVKGGWVMIPIGICSIIAVAVSVERGISLRRQNVIPPDFLDGLKTAFGPGNQDVAAGIKYCDLRPCAVSNIFKAGISRMETGAAAMEKAIEDAGSREVYKLKRSVQPLSVIATVAPLLGLLGTVYGMISAFGAASAMGVGKGDALAVGIYEALVTTAAGLTLAIPVLIVHQMFCSRVDSLVDDIDDQALQLLEYTAYNGKDHSAGDE